MGKIWLGIVGECEKNMARTSADEKAEGKERAKEKNEIGQGSRHGKESAKVKTR